ncbi:MAG: zinc ABC transporter substrate-binding protein [Firmicutes bacterium]|nr:zinc ABC transporter substrate-binding protein [Bacillota bacterium]
MKPRRKWKTGTLVTVIALAIAGVGVWATSHDRQVSQEANDGQGPIIQAVGAENEYANVISQIGGKYVSVTGIMDNPNTDPHVYEASTTDARYIAGAQLVVENGVGYDGFIQKLEAASPNNARLNINVGSALGYPADLMNPHLWFKPTTMSRVAALIASDLSKLDPAHRAYFQHRLTAFDHSLQPWYTAIAQVKRMYHGAPVAVTEPVFDYVLQACGLNIKTPWSFQASVMNGTDPSPQDVQIEENLFKKHLVKVFAYNEQTPDSQTVMLLSIAKKYHIPTIGVYETMPYGHTYQTWMLDEVHILRLALSQGVSTETIS